MDSGVAVEIAESIRIGEGIFSLTKICYDGLGMLDWMSGSIIVASCSHGLWNGIAYVFFGFGTKTGALGIRNTAIFGPEIGVLGLITNAFFAVLLWQLWRTRRKRTQAIAVVG